MLLLLLLLDWGRPNLYLRIVIFCFYAAVVVHDVLVLVLVLVLVVVVVVVVTAVVVVVVAICLFVCLFVCSFVLCS